MAIASEQANFADFVVDLMQVIGPVRHQRMFGGHGIFLEGLMFGLIANNELYLKADADNRGEFAARGLAPFEYHKQGRVMSLSYYQAPEEVLEDSEAMLEWASSAYNAALRAAARKARKPAGKKRGKQTGS